MKKAFKLSEYGYANTMGVSPCGDDCHYQFCAIQDPRKRRRILKRKEPQMKPTQKKPITAFTVISTIILLLLTVLFIFPFYWILTGAFKSQPDTIMIPPQWWPKTPTMENFQQLMVQNPALQWLWNSVFISLATMLFGVYDLFLGRLCLGEETLLWATNSLCHLYRDYGPFRNKLS